MAACSRNTNVDFVESNSERILRCSRAPAAVTTLIQEANVAGHCIALRVTNLWQNANTKVS